MSNYRPHVAYILVGPLERPLQTIMKFMEFVFASMVPNNRPRPTFNNRHCVGIWTDDELNK